jgi:hypothetical protein
MSGNTAQKLVEVRDLKQRISQGPYAFLIPRMTVGSIVVAPLGSRAQLCLALRGTLLPLGPRLRAPLEKVGCIS